MHPENNKYYYIFMVTRNVSCIMMITLNLIDRRGGFVEYLFVLNHPFSSQNYHLRIPIADLAPNCLSLLSFLRSWTCNHNIMSTQPCHNHDIFQIIQIMACTIYFDLSHKYFIQFTYILRSIIICEKKIQIQPCLMLLRWVYIFFPKHTFAYNSIPFVIIVRVIFYMKSALAFLVIFAIPFKRLGNTSKYHAANKYSSSHPNILMYQYHYI